MHKLAIAVTALTLGGIASPAHSSTQPVNTDNPFATNDIPGIINSSSGELPISGGIVEEEINALPNFPGLPNVSSPQAAGDDSLIDTIGGLLGGGSIEDTAIDVLGRSLPGGLPSGISDIFSDILNGDIGGILGTLLDVFATENEIFQDISKIVLGDGWEATGDDDRKDTPPDPYKVRLPQAGKDAKNGSAQDSEDEVRGLLTRTPMAFRRDKANQYDQELGRAMAAPMLGEEGQNWLDSELKISSEILKEGATNTVSTFTKTEAATQATSTQDIVRASAEMSGIAAKMQFNEMQQTAKMQQSLWQIQRLNSAQLQLSSDTSEAADEANRRDRAGRSAGLAGAAYSVMIIPGLGEATATANDSSTPNAPKLFAE